MQETELAGYIHQALQNSKTKEDIYKDLLAQGFSVDTIEKNFALSSSPQSQEDTQKRTIRIVVTIGAVLVGAGIFSFIASNWEYMTRPAKVAIILAAMLTVYVIGWAMSERGYPKTASALMLLGTLIYGSNIFLVAQIFNIRSNWPDGFILWMLGALAVGWVLGSYGHFALAIFLGFIAVSGHPFGIVDAFADRYLFTSTVLLVITTAVMLGFGVAMRKRIPTEEKKYF